MRIIMSCVMTYNSRILPARCMRTPHECPNRRMLLACKETAAPAAAVFIRYLIVSTTYNICDENGCCNITLAAAHFLGGGGYEYTLSLEAIYLQQIPSTYL